MDASETTTQKDESMARSETAFQFVHAHPRTLTASSGQLSGESSKRKRRNSEANANKRQAIAANFQLLPHTGIVYNDVSERFAPPMTTAGPASETYNYPSGPEDEVQRTSPEDLPSIQCIRGLLDLFLDSIEPQDITPEAFDGNAPESGSSILPGAGDDSDPGEELWEQYFVLPAVVYDVDSS
jgi:hypothetical protein